MGPDAVPEVPYRVRCGYSKHLGHFRLPSSTITFSPCIVFQWNFFFVHQFGAWLETDWHAEQSSAIRLGGCAMAVSLTAGAGYGEMHNPRKRISIELTRSVGGGEWNLRTKLGSGGPWVPPKTVAPGMMSNENSNQLRYHCGSFMIRLPVDILRNVSPRTVVFPATVNPPHAYYVRGVQWSQRSLPCAYTYPLQGCYSN